MIETKRLYKIVWLLLFVLSACRFMLETASVSLFAAMIACGLPLLGALASERKVLDQSFLTILMVTVCAVASAIALAQWKVIGNGTPLDALIPCAAGTLWLIHQKGRVSQ
jgi:hypothetical protein